MRLKLTLAYDGSAYEGWQVQDSPRQPQTIQGAVETALFTLTGSSIRVMGAGRTDSGVHALGQVCHADVPEKDWDWRKRLNAVLPRDIRITEAMVVSGAFHARKDAAGKTYFYNFWTESAYVAPCWRDYVWSCGPLNAAAMRDAAKGFLGVRDFASFQNAGAEVAGTEREITFISLENATPDLCPGNAEPILRLVVSGNGFLKQMVRNMAGFLAAVGRGRLAGAQLAAILEAKKRTSLPSATAPARGLFLASVEYRACQLDSWRR